MAIRFTITYRRFVRNLLLPLLLFAAGVGTAYAQTNRAARSEKEFGEFSRKLQALSTDSLFRLGTNYIMPDVIVPDSALMCFVTAQRRLDSTTDVEDLKAIAKSYINSAYIYSSIYHDFSRTYIDLRKAEEICRENKFDTFLAHVYLNIGATLYTNNLISNAQGPGATSKESIAYLKQAFELARRVKYYEGMGLALFNLVNNYTQIDNPELLHYVRLYLDTNIPDSEPTKQYTTEMARGIEAIARRDTTEAMIHFATMDTIDNQPIENYGAFLRALSLQAEGKHDLAIAILADIGRRAAGQKKPEQQLWIAGTLYFFEKESGQPEQADRYLLDYFKIKEELASANDSTATIAEIDLRTRLEAYERQLHEAELHESHQRSAIIAVSIVAAFIILILLLALRYSHSRRRYIAALYERLRQPAPEQPTEKESEQAETAIPDLPVSPSTETENEELTRRIEEVLDTDPEVYDPNFQMAVLCAKVNSNTTYVSRAINTRYGKNFKSVLTERRIRRACQKFDNPQENELYTIEAICIEVGFKSRAAFSVAFKNVTGLTPSEYRKAARRYMPPR